MDKSQCQALLLMPKSRRWAKYGGEEIRCKWSAKDNSSFCGVHAKLGDFIDTIIWKEKGVNENSV